MSSHMHSVFIENRDYFFVFLFSFFILSLTQFLCVITVRPTHYVFIQVSFICYVNTERLPEKIAFKNIARLSIVSPQRVLHTQQHWSLQFLKRSPILTVGNASSVSARITQEI